MGYNSLPMPRAGCYMSKSSNFGVLCHASLPTTFSFAVMRAAGTENEVLILKVGGYTNPFIIRQVLADISKWAGFDYQSM